MAQIISFPTPAGEQPARSTNPWPGQLIDLDAARGLAGITGEEQSDDDSVSSHSSAARTIAIRSLAAKGRSVAEMRQRLLDRGFDREDVEMHISQLQLEGLLDDEKLASELVYSLGEKKKLGPGAIRQELAKRKIPSSIIERVVDSSEDTRAHNLEILVHQRLRTVEGFDREVQIRRLLGYLARRGYTGTDVYHAVTTALSGGDSAHRSSSTVS